MPAQKLEAGTEYPEGTGKELTCPEKQQCERSGQPRESRDKKSRQETLPIAQSGRCTCAYMGEDQDTSSIIFQFTT